jgi:hypothetical protein
VSFQTFSSSSSWISSHVLFHSAQHVSSSTVPVFMSVSSWAFYFRFHVQSLL